MNHAMNIDSSPVTQLLVSTPEAAERIIRPHASLLRAAVSDSFEDWSLLLQRSPAETAGVSNYVRTRYVHDRTVYRLATAQASGDHPGLRVTKVKGLWVVVLSDAILLKLKKLTVSLRSKNIQTNQTVAFDHQGAVLFEAPDVTNATSGYVADSIAAMPVRFVVVCWDGDRKVWEVDLDSEARGGAGVVAEIPAAPAPEAPSRTAVVAEGEREAPTAQGE